MIRFVNIIARVVLSLLYFSLPSPQSSPLPLEKSEADALGCTFDWLTHVTKFYLCAGILPMAASGFVFAWPTPSLPKLEEISSSLHLTSDKGAWVVTAMPIGACFGTILSALLLDRIGRKLFLYLTSVPFLICWVLTLIAGSWVELFVGRLIGGISVGALYSDGSDIPRRNSRDENQGSFQHDDGVCFFNMGYNDSVRCRATSRRTGNSYELPVKMRQMR